MNSRPAGWRRLEPRRTSGSTHSRPLPDRQGIVAVLVVAVVVVAAFVAAGRDRSSPQEAVSGTEVSLSRTLSCVRDAGHPSMRLGAVGASGVTPEVSTGLSSTRVTFTPQSAAKGYASQWLRGHGWLGARACPSPADDWWFVGVGAGFTHHSVLTLDNTRANDANVTITVFGPHGRVQAPGLSGLLVPAGESRSIGLQTVAPAIGDLTVHVSVVRGLVAASVWDTWAQTPTSSVVSAWVPWTAAPATQTGLLGVPADVDNATLVVTNPNSTSAIVGLRATTGSATFVPAKHPSLTVAPFSTASVALTDLIALGVGGIQLTSSVPVAGALRSVRHGVEAYAAPALRLGTQSTVGLPSGALAQVVVAAPTKATVLVTAVDAAGTTVLQRTLTVAASTGSVSLPRNAVAVKISSDAATTATAAVVVEGGGIAVIGMVPTGTAATVPAILALPY